MKGSGGGMVEVPCNAVSSCKPCPDVIAFRGVREVLTFKERGDGFAVGSGSRSIKWEPQ